MRVLITGVNGFVGRRLAGELNAAGHEVHGTVLGGVQEAPGAAEGLTAHVADLRRRDELERAVSMSAPDVIVHLAGLSHIGSSWDAPADYFEINFVGTRNLLDAADGRRVVFASSADVYGDVPVEEQPIAEDRPPRPASPYGLTKACAEHLVLAHDGIVVRSFNAIGAGQATTFALPSFAARLAAIHAGALPALLEHGDLSRRRDFIHVDDAAAGYRAVIERGEAGGVYNLASGQAWLISEALDRLLALADMGHVERRRRSCGGRRRVDPELMLGDISRLRALGWEPRRDLDTALAELWQDAAGPADGGTSR